MENENIFTKEKVSMHTEGEEVQMEPGFKPLDDRDSNRLPYHHYGACNNLFCPCGTLAAQPDDPTLVEGGVEYADILAEEKRRNRKKR